MTKENYKNLYDSLMQHRKCCPVIIDKNDPKYIYHEEHHIIMRTMGGSNDKDNLVNLYAWEHFLAHKMLMHIYADTKYASKVGAAFWRMCYCHKDKQYHLDKKAKDFQKEKEYAIKILAKTSFNRIRINDGKHMKYVFKNELEKFLEMGYVIGRLPLTDTAKQKIRQTLHGRPSPMKGKSHTDSAKAKMSKSRTGKKSPTKNKFHITDGIHETFIDNIKNIPVGWRLGRKDNFQKIPWNKGLKTKPLTQKQKDTRAKNSTGRKHYTNGLKNIFVYPGSQPNGFYPGQVNHKK